MKRFRCYSQKNVLHKMTQMLIRQKTCAKHKNNIFLKKSDTGLSKDSVVLTPQVGIVDKSCLVEKLGVPIRIKC